MSDLVFRQEQGKIAVYESAERGELYQLMVLDRAEFIKLYAWLGGVIGKSVYNGHLAKDAAPPRNRP